MSPYGQTKALSQSVPHTGIVARPSSKSVHLALEEAGESCGKGDNFLHGSLRQACQQVGQSLSSPVGVG